MKLRLDKVCRTYAAKPAPVNAISDVSLELSEGDFVAVQGPSGCGKTTVLLTAGGLLKPDSGQVLIGNQDPYALPVDERAAFRARSVGFVFQQFHLVPYLDVMDNVLSAALGVGSSGHKVRQRAEQLIEHFGLSHRVRHLPGELSSGERQRTAFARALLNKPPLLLADEPTGNLDRESAQAVLRSLEEFAESGGAVLLVTHDDRAVASAQRVIHLRDGQIVVPTDGALAGAS